MQLAGCSSGQSTNPNLLNWQHNNHLIRQVVVVFLGLEKLLIHQKRLNWSGDLLAGCLAFPLKVMMRSYCLSVN